ncbi:hypothetical protein GCM10010256_01900 [Streptomyces coeruleorubidus]|nr:hypothetical protein GCM10010256_01900 [Streptomyces coeruleorubidus]
MIAAGAYAARASSSAEFLALLQALEAMPPGEAKQRTVVHGDLAAVEAASGKREAACEHPCPSWIGQGA